MKWDHSFTSNFKKKCIYLVEVIGFLVLICLTGKVIHYALVDDIQSYTRVTFHELYNQNENIDVLFLGSSHCYRSLDTSVTDEMLQKNTFNAGTSSQRYDGSYAILVETSKKNKIETVYLDMYYYLADDIIAERENQVETYIISDYMKPSFNRLRYIVKSGNKESWINGLVPARREWWNMFYNKYIGVMLERKRLYEYYTYSYVETADGIYRGKGFVSSDNSFDGIIDDSELYAEPIKDPQFTDDSLAMLNKIMDYCENNNIKLVLFSAPMSEVALSAAGDYDSYVKQVKRICEPRGISYYDFNLCRKEYGLTDNEIYADAQHLNSTGTRKFSTLFCDFMNGNIAEEDIFVSTLLER